MQPSLLIAVLDANVLYPFTLRDTLLRAAAAGLFHARWSDKILDEATRNLVADHVVTAKQAARLLAAMTAAFPEARVIGFHKLVATMKNDPKDRHVVAAAVKAKAQVVVTLNVRDFRSLPEGIEAQTPDHFLVSLFDRGPGSLVNIVREQSAALRSPPRSFEEVTGALARVVPEFARRARGYSSE
jgi:predicted nucleic acid-binding protein